MKQTKKSGRNKKKNVDTSSAAASETADTLRSEVILSGRNEKQSKKDIPGDDMVGHESVIAKSKINDEGLKSDTNEKVLEADLKKMFCIPLSDEDRGRETSNVEYDSMIKTDTITVGEVLRREPENDSSYGSKEVQIQGQQELVSSVLDAEVKVARLDLDGDNRRDFLLSADARAGSSGEPVNVINMMQQEGSEVPIAHKKLVERPIPIANAAHSSPENKQLASSASIMSASVAASSELVAAEEVGLLCTPQVGNENLLESAAQAVELLFVKQSSTDSTSKTDNILVFEVFFYPLKVLASLFESVYGMALHFAIRLASLVFNFWIWIFFKLPYRMAVSIAQLLLKVLLTVTSKVLNILPGGFYVKKALNGHISAHPWGIHGSQP